MPTKHHLSKSDFLKYQTCPQYLWLWKNNRDVVPTGNPEDIERRIEQGNEVESYARLLFPEGRLAEGRFKEAQLNTELLLKNKTKIIFQATVITANGLLAMADVLEVLDNGRFVIYEVKSTTEIKKEHILDTAFQKAAFSEAGFDIESVRVIYLNKEFRKHGKIRPKELFVIEDINDKINDVYSDVKVQLNDAILYINKKDEPKTCSCVVKTKSNHCPTFAYFNPDIPEYSVFNLTRISNKKLGMLTDLGIINVTDVPDDFDLSENQRNQVTAAKIGEPIINNEEIRTTIAGLTYPLYFFDYETVSTAIPLFDGSWPYQQVPFQYSLHVQESPDAEIMHYEYLAKRSDGNPMPGLLAQLKNDIKDDDGTIIVWNQSFEMSRNKEMAKIYTDYKDFLLKMNSRIFDLMEIFSKQHHVHPGFLGKTSIKYVLPVLVPELSYKDLEIQNGSIATLRWFQMVTGDLTTEEQEIIYNGLLKYCHLDTLAMVEILNHLSLL